MISTQEATRIFQDPSSAIHRYAGAWDWFVSTGKLSGDTPRPVISESWQRCRNLGIDPGCDRAPRRTAPDELEARLARDDLGIAGTKVLRRYTPLAEAAGHVIALGDADGQILAAAGARGLRKQLERINFVPGGLWNTDTVGPNGVGTPLALGRPEFVFGPEHYCSGWQPWVCYGSPILHPETRQPVGVIDITGPVRSARLERFLLATTIAQSVGQALNLLLVHRHERLRAAFCDALRRRPGNGVVAISNAGRIIEANPCGLQHLGLPSNVCPDRFIGDIDPALWDAMRANEDRPAEIDIESGRRGARLYLEPLHRDGSHIGTLLTIAASDASARRPKDHRAPASSASFAFADLIGESPVFLRAVSLARAAAGDPCDNTVLLTGMSGTGKELIAHAIHADSARASRPFVILNCAALPAELAESELFGYAPGAFTGGRREGAIGKYEAADGGTLFMDEVDALPLDLQAKFLRVLESGEISAIGSHDKKLVDVRVVAAASGALRDRITSGAFRLDLFHRLGVIEIELPALRDRPGDVALLARHFIKRACANARRTPLQIPAEVMARLCDYAWPGNIRELRNLCARWALVVKTDAVQLSDLPPHLCDCAPSGENGRRELQDTVDTLILKAIEDHGGIAKAARQLGINRTTIYRRLKQRSRC
jgi:transcriptional regulator of acetoin/glycerol metabolism